jgi:hypothetical protein
LHDLETTVRRLVLGAAQMSGLMCLLFLKLDERATFRQSAETARARRRSV